MAIVSFKEVRDRCTEGRFFSYTGLNDKIYSPVSVFLVWFFVRLGWSGNAVSVLSGLVAMAGGAMMASSDPLVVFIGSFGYVLFFLLDYVDGGVARFNGKSGIGGQYVDWTMHVVSALGYAAGLLAGAVVTTGFWIVPFGVLTIVAVALSLDRYALGWFAIAMHYQQQRVKGTQGQAIPVNYTPTKPSFFYRLCRNFSTVVFHESFAIYVLPAVSFIQLFVSIPNFDFRVAIMLAGGVIYFPVVLYDLLKLANEGNIDHAYNKMFITEDIPKLPEDHFFG